jgi:predicted PurR-regulated permease PerM
MPPDRLPVAAFARRVLVVVAVVALALFLWRIIDALLLAFGAILFAVLLRTLARPLRGRAGLPDAYAIPLVTVALILLLSGVFWLAGSEVQLQIAEVWQRLPRSWEEVRAQLGSTPLAARAVEGVRSASPDIQSMLAQATGMASSALGALGNLVLVLFGGVYLAVQPRLYHEGAAKLVPPPTRESARGTLEACGVALRRWLLGQFIAMAITAVLTTTGLWLIGLPGYLALGLLAALAEFVPVLGSILAAVPALLLATTQGPEMVLWTLLVYVAVQQFQGNLITPLVTREFVQLPPALTLFAIFAFGLVLGPLGVLFAAPLAVVAFVAVKRLWVRETLGEDPESLPAA